MLHRLTLMGERLKADDMARHGTIMVVFVLLGGFFRYLYELSMGMMLPPAQYGALFSLISLLMIVSIFSQTIQTSIAKFTSKFNVEGKPGRINYLWKTSLKRTLLFGVASFLILVLLSPLISKFLNIDNNWYCVIVFSSFIFAFAFPANLGVLQGMQRFFPLGLSTALVGFLRLSIGVLLVSLGFGLYGGLLCVPLTFLAVFVITLFFLSGLAKVGNEKVEVSGLFSYAGLAMLAIAGFAVLTNIDVLLAKHYLSPENAGTYAAIGVLGRASLVAPMGIAIAMFPKTSDLFERGKGQRSILRKAMLLTILLGGGVVIVYWLFPEFVVNVLFGGKYPLAVPYIFKYGLAMFLFAISFLLMNFLLSLNQTKVAYPLLMVMVVQLGLIVFFHANIAQIVDIVLLSSAACLALMVPVYLMVRRRSPW